MFFLGGTTTEEVLERFESQKDTERRLQLLREKSEDEKKQLEKKLEELVGKFETFKFKEFKTSEKWVFFVQVLKVVKKRNVILDHPTHYETSGETITTECL